MFCFFVLLRQNEVVNFSMRVVFSKHENTDASADSSAGLPFVDLSIYGVIEDRWCAKRASIVNPRRVTSLTAVGGVLNLFCSARRGPAR